MSNVNLVQFAGIVSASPAPDLQTFQFAAIVSKTDIPDVQLLQFAAILSVSPGKPILHYAVNIRCNGPETLFTDMPVSGKKN